MQPNPDPEITLLLSAARDALCLWQPEADQFCWGSAWRKLIGLASDATLQPGLAEWQDRLHPNERTQVLAHFNQLLAGEIHHLESEHRLRCEDGSYRWVLASLRCDRSSARPLIAGSFTDINEHKLLDPYTRLPNRVQFLDRLERSLSRLRFGGAHAVGVLVITMHLPANHAGVMDHDEQVELARILGERIGSELRPWDFVALLDSLEYAVLLDLVAAGTNLPSITGRLFQSLRQPVRIGAHELQVGVAIGSADTASVAGDEENMLHAANSAARLAASLGNYHHVAYDPLTPDQLSHHLHIEQDIVGALVEQAFEPWYQPIVRITDGQVTGMEALVRWPRPEGVLLPARFLPFMEKSGLINQITWIMLQKGLEQQELWIEQGLLPADSLLSINLPADQLLDTQLCDQILALIEDSEIPARRIRLEIPEKAVLRSNPISRETLAHLRRSGANIAIDDVGTAQSSLWQLQSFPLDTLKIERCFVREIETSPSARGMVRAILALAKSMELEVIAKGVETPEQLAFLRENGVCLAQGFLFAQPMPASAVPEWMQGHGKELAWLKNH